jgi:hypothetical protein
MIVIDINRRVSGFLRSQQIDNTVRLEQTLTNMLFRFSKQQSTTMDELYHRLNALTFYLRSPLQHLAFEHGMSWWRISPSKSLREQVRDAVHLLEQVGYMENDDSFGKVKLSVLL